MTHAERLASLARADHVQLYAVTVTKRRAGKRYEVVYDRNQHKEAFRALNRLIVLTAQARTGTAADALWIVRSQYGKVAQLSWADQLMTLQGWYDRNVTGDPIEGPFKFSRLRKVAIARQAMNDPVRYLRDGRNHSSRTFYSHYSNSAVLRAQSGRLLVEAVTERFELATAGPTVVTPEAEDLLAKGVSTEALDSATADALLQGHLEGGLTACRDPEDSPFSAQGHLCPLSRSGRCFTCPNAIITQEHLPQLLAYERLSDPDHAVDETIWRQVWQPIHHGIAAVLPLFPSELVQQARTRANETLSDLGVSNDLRGRGV